MNDTKKPVAVYYNSACPVCKAGIEAQKGKMEACAIEWKDVHADNALVTEIGSELEFVRERLHLVDADGKVRVGFEAFLELWRNSPKERWLAAVLGLPIIRPCGRWFYNVFAAALYRWNRAKQHW